MGLWTFALAVFAGVLLLMLSGPLAAGFAVVAGVGLVYARRFTAMTRPASWFLVGTLLLVAFGFPLVVALSPRAASLCVDHVETFDSASAHWAWLPPGVECRVSLDSGGMTRFVVPWQQPDLGG